MEDEADLIPAADDQQQAVFERQSPSFLFHVNLASGISFPVRVSLSSKCIFTLSLYFAADTSIFLILSENPVHALLQYNDSMNNKTN